MLLQITLYLKNLIYFVLKKCLHTFITYIKLFKHDIKVNSTPLLRFIPPTFQNSYY